MYMYKSNEETEFDMIQDFIEMFSNKFYENCSLSDYTLIRN